MSSINMVVQLEIASLVCLPAQFPRVPALGKDATHLNRREIASFKIYVGLIQYFLPRFFGRKTASMGNGGL